ncbi:MAG: 2-C-methyl-D-erythritol 4-phosphate cytidylyltransferase [Candidatus Cloacimonetes bacterium]|nr:2-C-methyl-D-erythritol 4-phosphate cytidylyltransferase [Candidatus Cloacimonadota bacterium]
MNKKKIKTIAIITAGGSGNRLKSDTKKQFIEIAGRPLIFWTLDKFTNHLEIDEIIVTLPEDEIKTYSELIENEYPQDVITTLPGGEERQDSVFNALLLCSSNTKYILIHDGVRPFISSEDITRLLESVEEHKAVIPISKIKNTIKEIQNNKIIKTISKENLVNALTPQVFEFDLIKSCHQKAKSEKLYFTDDAAILEHFGYPVYTVECDSFNIKITDIHDLQIAKVLLENNFLKDN